MKFFIASLGVCLLVCSGIAAQTQALVSVQELQHPMGKQARVLLKRGLREYFQRHYEQALGWMHKAIEVEPDSWTLENDIGVVYCSLGKDKEAERSFEEATQHNSNAALSYTNLSAVSFNLYDYRTAEKAAREALRISPLSAQAEVMLGLAEVAQGHWTTEARRYLQDNREGFQQAEVILEHWPDRSKLARGIGPVVQGAGPGAYSGVTADRARVSALALAGQ